MIHQWPHVIYCVPPYGTFCMQQLLLLLIITIFCTGRYEYEGEACQVCAVRVVCRVCV